MMAKQKDALFRKRLCWILILSILLLLLIVGLLVANHVIGIYHFNDTYVNADGVSVTDRYTVKKQDGVYALFDRSGKKMEQNQDGTYIAAGSGNQYTIDPDSGAWSLYAVVAYDEAGGESLAGQRVLIFPQILLKDLASVKVQNNSESYEIYRDESGNVRVLGIDNPNVTMDQQKFSSFAVAAGYPVTTRKLDPSSPGVQKKQDGSLDYASYGLEVRYGEGGEILSSPETYTVSARDSAKAGYEIDPERTYTVLIGDKTLDGNGYYVRLAGRNAIYIMTSERLDSTLRARVEELIYANVVIPTTVNTYPMVQDFLLARMTLQYSFEDVLLDPIVRFDYRDQYYRSNTLFETRPYICRTELMEGYEINDDKAAIVLERLHELTEPTCVRLGLGQGDALIATLAEYGISGEIFYLTYCPLLVSGNSYGYSEGEVNLLLIGQKTERDTYYVASIYYDMLLEVDQYYFSFLEWEDKEWYASHPVWEDLSYVKEFSIEDRESSYHFELDNSLSYAYYIDEEGQFCFPSVANGEIGLLANGSYVYMPNEGGKYTLYKLEFDNEELYCDKDGKALLEPSVNSNYVRVFSPEAGGELDYTVLKKTITDLGEERYKTLSALDNFRYFWKRFLYFMIEGDIDRVSFEKLTGYTVEDYLALRVATDGADYTIRYRVKDNASSGLTYIDESGKPYQRYSKDNEKDIILRFYCYSGQKALLTIEKVTEYDAEGNPVEHPENTVGRFFVQSDYLESLVRNAGYVVRGELVEDIG